MGAVIGQEKMGDFQKNKSDCLNPARDSKHRFQQPENLDVPSVLSNTTGMEKIDGRPASKELNQQLENTEAEIPGPHSAGR
jgi:hypothetical protein